MGPIKTKQRCDHPPSMLVSTWFRLSELLESPGQPGSSRLELLLLMSNQNLKEKPLMAAMMCHSSASVRKCKLSASWMVKAVVQVALQN